MAEKAKSKSGIGIGNTKLLLYIAGVLLLIFLITYFAGENVKYIAGAIGIGAVAYFFYLERSKKGILTLPQAEDMVRTYCIKRGWTFNNNIDNIDAEQLTPHMITVHLKDIHREFTVTWDGIVGTTKRTSFMVQREFLSNKVQQGLASGMLTPRSPYMGARPFENVDENTNNESQN